MVIYKSQLIHTIITVLCFCFKYYGMTTPRKRGLVIDNKIYKYLNSLRKGSDKDVKNVIPLLEALGFKVPVSREVSYIAG